MPKFEETDNFIVDLRDPGDKMKSHQENDQPKTPMAGGFWYFIRYNNAFLIIMMLAIFTFGSLVFASDDVRKTTIGEKQVRAEGIDNTLLLTANLDEFNMDFKITGIVEDDEKFLLSYSFVDLDVIDNNSLLPANEQINALRGGDFTKSTAWQYVEKNATRRINKPFRKDLGLYLAQQLSQEAKTRLKELKQKQKEAQGIGETKTVQITQYSGLIGKILDLSTTIFPEYEPVKKIELPAPEINEQARDRLKQSQSDNLTNVYNEWVNNNPEKIINLSNGLIDSTSSETIASGTSANLNEATSTASDIDTSDNAVTTEVDNSSDWENVGQDEIITPVSEDNDGTTNNVINQPDSEQNAINDQSSTNDQPVADQNSSDAQQPVIGPMPEPGTEAVSLPVQEPVAQPNPKPAVDALMAE